MRLTASLRAVAATVLVAATFALLPASPASAAACAGTSGISVVVDPNALGGGISAGCDRDGGIPAVNNFADAGYRLEYSSAPGMTGFVCKINGRPADGDCARTDAYWSLWWSDGTSSRWTYATRGAGSLRVPEGGVVAFAWHEGAGQAAPPNADPKRTAPAPPRPSKKPTPKPAPKPTKPGTRATPTPSGASTPTATSSSTATPSSSATPTAPTSSASASSPATDAPVPTDPGQTDVPSVDDITSGPDDASADTVDSGDGGGFPVWLGAVLAVVVLGGAAAVPILRRRG
ncbi:hypothetical protein [Pimelobacter sp. 30-1]|uniref:hypothetical protein n=1 Tax=Pimelobacter sp. 30-1 TaxID=2004991 RepID=UPI001C044B1A|nr:hypothetical protein [Pimelobacter sp. 30-1]MBU2696359.1 hypothetical protein [Pimelobacter sp. 30-1]